MVTSSQILAFGLTSLVLILIPGPSVLFVIGRALAHGRRVAVLSVVGNSFGLLAVATLVAIGLGASVQRSELAFTIVKGLGATYLVHLGIRAFRARRHLELATAAPAARTGRRALWDGFVVGVANPKLLILFTAILPQFVDRSAGHVPSQMLQLALVSFVIALICDTGWALAASGAREWFASSPRRLRRLGGAGGLAMIGLGVSVAVTGRRD